MENGWLWMKPGDGMFWKNNEEQKVTMDAMIHIIFYIHKHMECWYNLVDVGSTNKDEALASIESNKCNGSSNAIKFITDEKESQVIYQGLILFLFHACRRQEKLQMVRKCMCSFLLMFRWSYIDKLENEIR